MCYAMRCCSILHYIMLYHTAPTIIVQPVYKFMDSLGGSSVKLGAIQRRLPWPLRKDDTCAKAYATILRIVYLEEERQKVL